MVEWFNRVDHRIADWIPPEFFLPALGWWEVGIGQCMLFRPLVRVAILCLFFQLPGTLLPLFLLPEVCCFTHPPFALTLEGQHIIKNLFLISAALAIGSTVRHQRSKHTLL